MQKFPKRIVRLDIVATDSQGRRINIEIQREDSGASWRRARYHSSMMDADFLSKGEEFYQLPETCIIFITEHDVIGMGLPLYHIERCISENKEHVDDGAHIIYVNGAIQDDKTALGRLMHDFHCSNPKDTHYKVLADRASFFKNTEEGESVMGRIMEEGRDIAMNMLRAGRYDLQEIADITSLPVDQLSSMQAQL